MSRGVYTALQVRIKKLEEELAFTRKRELGLVKELTADTKALTVRKAELEKALEGLVDWANTLLSPGRRLRMDWHDAMVAAGPHPGQDDEPGVREVLTPHHCWKDTRIKELEVVRNDVRATLDGLGPEATVSVAAVRRAFAGEGADRG